MTDATRISKQLSFWLRHKPEDAGITLSPEGWTPVAPLLKALEGRGLPCNPGRLQEVVSSNDKQRFELSEDGSQIRARQGHSVSVDLGLASQAPPDFLFHGTAEKTLPLILETGLKPMNRHHVHLSPDRGTARKVGSRHGKPAILVVAARSMSVEGHQFYRTENGVWLTLSVPVRFLEIET